MGSLSNSDNSPGSIMPCLSCPLSCKSSLLSLRKCQNKSVPTASVSKSLMSHLPFLEEGRSLECCERGVVHGSNQTYKKFRAASSTVHCKVVTVHAILSVVINVRG